MAQPPIQQTLQEATARFQSGQLHEAHTLCGQILASQPDHPDALHLLGLVTFQLGDKRTAIGLLRQAVAAKPDSDQALFDLAQSLRATGQPAEAAAALRHATKLWPDSAAAWNKLGNVLRTIGQRGEAIDAYHKALSLQPDHVQTLFDLGITLRDGGNLESAIDALRRASELRPDNADILQHLASALRAAGRLDQATEAYRGALSMRPDNALILHNLGGTLLANGKPDQAAAALQAVVALRGQSADAHHYLAYALQLCGRYEQAKTHYLQAFALQPNLYAPRVGYAVLLWSMGQRRLAWDEFFKVGDLQDPLSQTYPGKKWDGSDPRGKTILVYTQGLYGDCLIQSRFVPLLCQRGARVLLQCLAPMVTLLQSLGAEQTLAVGTPPPPFDFYAPLGTLPSWLGITFETIPNSVPYLSVDPQRAATWSPRVPHDGTLNIGLVWAARDHSLRSHRLEIFAPLAQLPGVRFFSLQKGPESSQTPPAGMNLLDFTADLQDFADTAALLQQLDLVISVDTSVVHLAGALAKPVWVLIPLQPGFYWLPEGGDCPWYPTMRLFRQKRWGDWQTPVEEMALRLRCLLRGDGKSNGPGPEVKG